VIYRGAVVTSRTTLTHLRWRLAHTECNSLNVGREQGGIADYNEPQIECPVQFCRKSYRTCLFCKMTCGYTQYEAVLEGVGQGV
jgi:hypothetical protein